MGLNKFREMAQHTGRTVGETASYQRSAGYSEEEIAEFRVTKDRCDDMAMSRTTEAA